MDNLDEMILLADNGDKKMAEKVATMYMKGTGVEKDISKAIKYFEKAAENGSAMGYYQLGKAYQKGTGVEIDLNKAKEYLKKSADMGYVNAINTLNQLDEPKEPSKKATASSGVAYKAPSPPKISNNTKKDTTLYSGKSKTVAILLAIFLGTVGGENWYLGYIGRAIIQLVLGFTGISTIWGFIDAILIGTGKIDTDAKGGKLQ